MVRGAAVIGMIIYHLLWDLQVWNVVSIPLDSIWAVGLQRIVLVTFLLVAGVSWWLKFVRLKKNEADNRELWISFGKQGGVLLGTGLLVSLFTWLMFGEAWVRFGVLHLIGLATLLAPWWVRLPSPLLWSVGLLLLNVLADAWLPHGSHGWRWGLGEPPLDWQSVDFVPLIPWLSWLLIGLGIGRWWFDRERLKRTPEIREFGFGNRILVLMGQWSLWIYLLHQPVIWGLWWMIRQLSLALA